MMTKEEILIEFKRLFPTSPMDLDHNRCEMCGRVGEYIGSAATALIYPDDYHSAAALLHAIVAYDRCARANIEEGAT